MQKDSTPSIPLGYCRCGCGKQTLPSRIGLPTLYIQGHWKKGRTLEDRFWEKVVKSNDCWEWIGGRHDKGYGQIEIQGRKLKAHRVSWELAFGPVSENLHVLHRCDNPACVRPDHLFIGTNDENVQDKMAKGRHLVPRGEEHQNAVLTAETVREIRRLRASGVLLKDIAAKFGVSESTVRGIVSYRGWKHVDPLGEADLIRQEGAAT